MAARKRSNQGETADRGAGRIARNRMRIAWMYYVEGLTQNDIAERLGIGRVTVVRNLNEALKQREVKIWIDGDVSECMELERELKAAFGFRDAVVVPEPSDPANINKSIGVAAGMFMTDALSDNMAIGVGWGDTLHESLGTFSPRDVTGVQVVSLLGGVVQARRFNPSEFAWQFANVIGADCYLLAAPAVVDSPETKKALIERCGLDEVLRRAEHLDMALLSVGDMRPNSTALRFGFLTEEERTSLIKAGAVGDLLYNFFGSDGQLVTHSVNSRVMSFPIDKLKDVPRRIIASGGLGKVDALLGAIPLVDCNALITTEATARELLARKR
jgi:deoxyribonucleoside regulator